MVLSASDPEPLQAALGIAPGYLFALDIATQPGVANRLAEPLQLGLETFGHEFDAAVRQVAHRSCHLVGRGNGSDRVTEPDALDAAGIEDCESAGPGGGWGGGRGDGGRQQSKDFIDKDVQCPHGALPAVLADERTPPGQFRVVDGAVVDEDWQRGVLAADGLEES
jgi:hypothetical protein